MRIETTGDYAWRTDLYDDIGDRLGESTRSGAIDASAEFTRQMLPALAEAVEHPDMTEELTEVISTRTVNIEYCVETALSTD